VIDPAVIEAYAARLSAKQGRPISLAEAESSIHLLVCGIAKKFEGWAFGAHAAEDISQQCVVWGLEALGPGSKYDASRSLGIFLYVHMSNRLKNLKRSQQFRGESPCRCCSVVDPPAEPCERYRKYLRANAFRVSLAKILPYHDAAGPPESPDQIALAGELDRYIRARLDPQSLVDYVQVLQGERLPNTYRVQQLRAAVRRVLGASPYAEMVPRARPRKDVGTPSPFQGGSPGIPQVDD
jgi:hypothetical protein